MELCKNCVEYYRLDAKGERKGDIKHKQASKEHYIEDTLRITLWLSLT